MGDEYVSRAPEPVEEPRHVVAAPQQRVRRGAARVLVQAQLTVGPAGDPYEQEADRVAAEVMRHLGRQPTEDDLTTIEDDAAEPSRLRRAAHRVTFIAATHASDDRNVQRYVSRIQLRATAPTVGLHGGDVDADTDAAIRRATGKGRPLDSNLRQSMEQSFGADFSAVRVHADSEADDLNRKVQAKAFTTGRDIFFGAGQYTPSSRGGQELLAHELVHVVQQRAAGVYRRPASSRRVRRSTIERASSDEQTALSENTSGKGRSKITLSGPKGVIGSVTVDAVDESSVEATNLAVEPSQRGRGYGSDLVAAAARSAEGLGRSRVTLGSQDDGSGKLDGWYKSLGFTKTGTSSDRTSRFEAPTAALRRSRVQRTAARLTSPSGQRRVLRTAELRENTRIRRMEPTWYELVDGKIEGRVGQKPGGYRLVRGVLSPTGKAVFETKEQRATHVEKPKTYAELVGVLPAADSTAEFSVDAQLVRFSQDSIGRTFASGAPIADLAASLKNGTTKPSALPAIRVLMSKGGRLVTLDNRRLWCCKEAGVKIKCVWATEEEVAKEGYKFTSSQGKDGLTTITVRT